MATLVVDQSTDFRRLPAEIDIDRLVFGTKVDAEGEIAAAFHPGQFGPGLISTSLIVEGSEPANSVQIWALGFPFPVSFSAADWAFVNWGAEDYLFVVGGYDDDTLIGSDGPDRIIGDAGADSVLGGDGNDTLSCAYADLLDGHDVARDTLVGGAGDDLYQFVMPPLLDVIIELPGEGTDTISSDRTISLKHFANVENLVLLGRGNQGTGNELNNTITGNAQADALRGERGRDQLIGRGENDTLIGGSGKDTLNGGEGSDRISGGKGNDLMRGGEGADTFVFRTVRTGNDRIDGFEGSSDWFDLSGGSFSALIEARGNTTLTHAGGTIVITDVTGLSLEQWNQRVISDTESSSHMAIVVLREALGVFGERALFHEVIGEYLLG